MIKIDLRSYSDYICYAESCKYGNIYPLSIAEGYHQGDIYVNSINNTQNVLFWHFSGFAFISGEYNRSFLESVYDIISDKNGTNPRRFILFADEQTMSFFETKENIDIERRYFFGFENKTFNKSIALPSDCKLKPIDKNLLSKIKGRITPYFSWDNADEFLSKGKGYCVVCGEEVTAWAFSSAVSSNEIDIGVETAEKYQHKGLALAVSTAMIQYILAQNKTPVWACHYKNIASAKLAERSGFDRISECYVIKSKDT